MRGNLGSLSKKFGCAPQQPEGAEGDPTQCEYWRHCAIDGFLTETAVKQVELVLKDPERRKAMVEKNFELGKKYFSYSALKRGLSALLSSFFGTIPSGNLAGGMNGQ